MNMKNDYHESFLKKGNIFRTNFNSCVSTTKPGKEAVIMFKKESEKTDINDNHQRD